VAHLFKLGHLPTEQPHPDTGELSRWARSDLPHAVSVLKRIDLRALGALKRRAAEIDRLALRIRSTFEAGNRVFLCGCGATGRLSLALEYLWRQLHGADNEQVVSFMAGGDVALVHSLEGFEDYPSRGARHLEQMGFKDGDLLIASTEGGETPYVIGATERAAEISSNRPYFLYCNSDSSLTRRVERFRRVYDNPNIDRVSLFVGPMALAGSTRMQASTVLQLAVGAALLHPDEPASELLARFEGAVAGSDFSFLTGLIERESAIYSDGGYVTYRVRDYGITVFTDTTERSPTFSLVAFDQLTRPLARHSLCYVSLDQTDSSESAWVELLNRQPRALDWPRVDPRTTPGYLLGFDFSAGVTEKRRAQIPAATHHEFRIHGVNGSIEFDLDGLTRRAPVDDQPLLFRHLLLKQMLNIHSTLVMGRLGRYRDNLMTWVTPTNGKLVDRATRYVKGLLDNEGHGDRKYEEVVHQLFAEMDRAAPDESVVLRTYRSLSRNDVSIKAETDTRT
jgi:N-acetylmuramic acid 6-phosphate etherase